MAEVKDSMTSSDERTPREIRDDIRRTRARMDATVDAIDEKLTPGELVHEAWSLVRGGSGSSVNRVWRIAKQHPMPTAIIGLGLSWMAYESTGGDARNANRGHYDARYPHEEHLATDAGATSTDAAASVRRATEAAGEKVSDLAGDAREMASDVAGSVRRQASELSRQASELGGQARQGMHQARVGLWETLEEQPLVVGVATLAAGLLVGLLLPSTPREDELMGKTRDSLINEVKGLGQDALKKGQQIASAAAVTLKQGADAQGLSAYAVVEKVRAVGREVVETVKTEAEKQNLMPEAASDDPRRAHQESPQPPRHRAA